MNDRAIFDVESKRLPIVWCEARKTMVMKSPRLIHRHLSVFLLTYYLLRPRRILLWTPLMVMWVRPGSSFSLLTPTEPGRICSVRRVILSERKIQLHAISKEAMVKALSTHSRRSPSVMWMTTTSSTATTASTSSSEDANPATLASAPNDTATSSSTVSINHGQVMENAPEQDEEELDTSIYTREAEALAKLQSPFLCTLRDRGFLHQCTGLSELDTLLSATNEGGQDKKKIQSAYLGFDATADSLHVGSLLQIMILRHLQKSGHRPVVLVGGGTSKVGDPTGKDESRVMLNEAVIDQNIAGISKVFAKFLKFAHQPCDEKEQQGVEHTSHPTDAIMVNNNDWLVQLKYLDFLREYGTHFTINRMLSFESVRQRLAREAPFSFLEFNYMILQAYDFLELYRRHDVLLQLGGSDQWGNMVAGVELGRRVAGAQLYALTAPLITTSDGKKMGKTAGGAVWLNADKLSEYDYWQFWRNTADDDVIRFLKLFTELPLDEIDRLAQLQGSEINQAKVILADQATALLHGPECLETIHATVQNMFSGSGASTEGLPRVYVQEADVNGGGVKVADLMVELGLAPSKKEARRLIQGGGARLGESKIEEEQAVLTWADFAEGAVREVTLRAGKKRAGVIEMLASGDAEQQQQ